MCHVIPVAVSPKPCPEWWTATAPCLGGGNHRRDDDDDDDDEGLPIEETTHYCDCRHAHGCWDQRLIRWTTSRLRLFLFLNVRVVFQNVNLRPRDGFIYILRVWDVTFFTRSSAGSLFKVCVFKSFSLSEWIFLSRRWCFDSTWPMWSVSKENIWAASFMNLIICHCLIS